MRETGGIDDEPSGLEADAFASDVIRAAFVAEATPYLRAFRPLDGLCALLEEAARRRLDALPLAAVVAQIAALAAGELLALARHVRPRLVPSEAPPAAAVAARLVQMDAAALRELGRRLQERRAPAAAEGRHAAPGVSTRGPWQKTLRVDFCPSTRRQPSPRSA